MQKIQAISVPSAILPSMALVTPPPTKLLLPKPSYSSSKSVVPLLFSSKNGDIAITTTTSLEVKNLSLPYSSTTTRKRERRSSTFVCGAVTTTTTEAPEERWYPRFLLPERMKVLCLVALVMCLCNADRVVMSVAAVPLCAKHGWSTSYLGVVQSSFLWGYLVSSIVGGALVDKHGGKLVMAVGVVLWSLATIITPWAANHSTMMLMIVRTLFGLAEGVAIPAMNVILSQWFPSCERASAVGLSMAGFHLGNAISFLATPVLMNKFGITGPFTLFSILGFIWMSIWTLTTAKDPSRSHAITLAELHIIREGKPGHSTIGRSLKSPSIAHLLSKMPTWAIILANVTNNWGYFVLLSWMPVYFRTVFDVNLKQAAWFSAIPWGLMAVSGYIAGLSSDHLMKSGYSVTTVRKIMQSIGFIGPGLALLCLNFARTPSAASFLLTIALSLSSFSQAGFLLNVQARYCSQMCRLSPWDIKFIRNSGSNCEHNGHWIFCSMVGILPSIPNSNSCSLLHFSHLLEHLCHWRASFLLILSLL